MLFIYGALPIGGIEVFFVRMAKERSRQGKTTKILLVRGKKHSNPALLEELHNYAEVYFLEDYVNIPNFLFNKIPFHFLLLLPLNKRKLAKIYENISQVHVSGGIYAFLNIRLMQAVNVDIPLTIGVYHLREFTWSNPQNAPFYEKQNEAFFFSEAGNNNLVFFNEKVVDYYEQYIHRSMKDVNIFPIGVITTTSDIVSKNRHGKKLTIGSVGRLVKFKAYNLWMLDVISDLLKEGIEVDYLIYGDGPLMEEMQRKISALGLENSIYLKGNLEYADFSNVVSEMDLFVGSGTAIVEAAGLGVPSIIGIESIEQPITYGFLSQIPGFTYHEDNLYPKVNVIGKIIEYFNMSENERISLKRDHLNKAKLFSMEACVSNFEDIPATSLDEAVLQQYSQYLFRLRYSLSFFAFSVFCRLQRKTLSEAVYG